MNDDELMKLAMPESDDEMDDVQELNNNDNKNVIELFKEGNLVAVYERLHQPSIEELTAQDEHQNSILSLAAQQGNLDLVKYIVENLPYEKIPGYNWRPLREAIANDRFTVFEYLAKLFPNVTAIRSPSTGDSLLHVAMVDSNGDTVQRLAAYFPVLDTKNFEKQTIFDIARDNNYNIITTWLCKYVQSGKARTKTGDTELHLALLYIDDEDNLIKALEELLQYNTPLDIPNNDGVKPLDLPMTPRVRGLLEAEAIFRKDYPLHCTVRSGKLEAVEAWLAKMDKKYPDKDAWKENVASALTATDTEGRTVLMYAAKAMNIDTSGVIINRLLQYYPADKLNIMDNSQKTVLDYLINEDLVCQKNSEGKSNTNLLKTIDAICRKGKLSIDPSHITRNWDNGTPPLECTGDCEEEVDRNLSDLAKLAYNRNWDELHTILKKPLSYQSLNAMDEMGNTVLHYVCQFGQLDVLRTLLKQKDLEIDLFSSYTRETALKLAADANQVKIVRTLLKSNADPEVNDDADLSKLRANANKSWRLIYDTWELSRVYHSYYLANVPNVATALDLIQAGQTPMHVAMQTNIPENLLDSIRDSNIDLNQKDKNGNTALMMAAWSGILSNVKYLLNTSIDPDLRNINGKTALMLAAQKGYTEIVQSLVDQCDVDLQDEDGKTALMLAAISGHDNVTDILVAVADIDVTDKDGNNVQALLEKSIEAQDKDDDRSSCLAKILASIVKEGQMRLNSPEYQEKLKIDMVTMSTEEVFCNGGFAKAIACSAELGQTFLDDCVELNRHEAIFKNLDAVFGKQTDTSALHAIVNLDTKDPELTFQTKKVCLEHVVFRRILEIKWELFGQRMYFEQLSMNLLLLVTMTTSSVLFKDEPVPAIAFVGCSLSVVTIALTYLVMQSLRPDSLYEIVRKDYDGTSAYDPSITIPDLAQKKSDYRNSLFIGLTFLCVIFAIPIVLVVVYYEIGHWFSVFNNIVLWITALYFVVNEMQEMRVGFFKYIKSNMNKAQLAVYIVILVFFVPVKLELFDASFEVQVGMGGLISLALWILSLQFLEVVPSASYLLPMLSHLFGDIWNFFILFGVFQIGLSVSFYLLFRGKTADNAFNTLGSSFMNTYFVAFGELQLDSLSALLDPTVQYSDVLYACTALLMMLHAAVVVIILLNVLLAMMNKTVDGGLEKAKTQALISYAQCILRFEEAMGVNEEKLQDLIYLKGASGNDKEGQEATKWLNPVFNEHVPRAQLGLSVDEAKDLQRTTTRRMKWLELMEEFDNAIDEQLDYLTTSLNHVQHFTSSNVAKGFEEEFKQVQKARKCFKNTVENARKSRGQFKYRVLKKLETTLKKEFEKFKDSILHVWRIKYTNDNDKMSGADKNKNTTINLHTECVLLYQLAQKANLGEQLDKIKKALLDKVTDAMNDDTDMEEDPEKAQLKSLKALSEEQSQSINILLHQLTMQKQSIATITSQMGVLLQHFHIEQKKDDDENENESDEDDSGDESS